MSVQLRAAGSFAGNATATSQAITAPACQAGDILIAAIINKSVTANTVSPPDGTWTAIIATEVNDCTTAADDHQYSLFWKRATTSGGSFTFTKAVDDNVLFGGVIVAYSGAVLTGSPIDATAPARTETAGAADNVTFPAFDPTETDVRVIFVAFYGNDLTTFAAAMSNDVNPDCTIDVDVESSTGNDCSIAFTSGLNDGSNVESRTWASNATTDAGNTGVVFALVADPGTVYDRIKEQPYFQKSRIIPSGQIRVDSFYDADYSTLLDAAISAGCTLPSFAKQVKENTAMKAIKAVFGVSSIISAPIVQGLMFKTDGDANYATFNWVNPSIRRATRMHNTQFIPDTGFNSDGTLSYLLSGITLADINQADFSIAIRGAISRPAAAGLVAITGAGDGTGTQAESLIVNVFNSVNEVACRLLGGVGADEVGVADSLRRIVVGRTNASDVHISVDGGVPTSFVNTANAAESTSRDITILAYNGSSLANYDNGGVSYRWTFSRKLTDSEIANFDAAIVNYLA